MNFPPRNNNPGHLGQSVEETAKQLGVHTQDLCLNHRLTIENAKIALDDFFSFCDEDESCVRAYKKLYRKGIREEKKMRSSLLTLGFSSKRIERIFKEIQNGES